MTSSFRVYIDESGDEGFTFLPDEQGSSRWLVLSALVFRREGKIEGYGMKFWCENKDEIARVLEAAGK